MTKLTLDQILEDVAEVFNLTSEQLKSPFRGRRLSRARVIFVYATTWLNENNGSLTVAKCMDKNHASVFKSRKTIVDYFESSDKIFLDDLKQYQLNSKLWWTIFAESKNKSLSYADIIKQIRTMPEL